MYRAEGTLRKTWEDAELSPLADLKAFHRQEVEAESCQLSGWALKLCPNVHIEPVHKDWEFRIPAVLEISAKLLANCSANQAETSVSKHDKEY